MDLSGIPVGTSFTARVVSYADVYDRRVNQEFPASFARAYLVESTPAGPHERAFTGLTVEGEPVLRMPAETPLPVCDTAPDPAAGELQFSADTSRISEAVGAGPQVFVTRGGGSSGAVSATVTTTDGTADGSDYASTTTTVNFADGDTTPRAVRVPIHHDLTDESNETVTLTLANPRGCARVGERDTATMTIVDDDRPTEPEPTYSVGGTVTGLEGDGLTLTHLGEQIAPLDGPFTFTEELPDGFPYDVRVATQPSAPDQTCSVTDGSGTIAHADVANIHVDCVTSSPQADLDPTFGGDGTITTPGLHGAKAITVQSDGKLVVAGQRFLARYDDADGGLDQSFGDGDGIVATDLDTGFLDVLSDVAIAPDGKTVAVGIDDNGPSEDFAIERFDSNGLADPGFGAAGTGVVTTDFHGGTDRAYGVAVQPDGKIVVAGHATNAAGTGNDFAVARYDVDGSLDATFGDDGTGLVTTNIAGIADFAYAVTLQPDGAIVLAGRVSDDGGGGYFGLARYTPDGRLDSTFGSGGTTIADFGHGGIAEGVVVQPDGKLLVAGNAVGDFALARFEPNGSPDETFGTGGLVTTDFGQVVGNTPAADYAPRPRDRQRRQDRRRRHQRVRRWERPGHRPL